MSCYYGYGYCSSSLNTALSAGAIAGIVIGCLAGLAVLISIIVTIFCVCKRKNRVQLPPPMFQGQGQMYPYPPGYYQQPPPASVNNAQYPLKV
jgi:hypothetical protein